MPEQPDRQKHRNRKYSLPCMGGAGKLNTFSRSDFLQGKSQVRFGHAQSLNALGGESGTDSVPKEWPKAGRVLGVPKVVVLSSMPCWPEFWKECQWDYPHDVVGTLFSDPSTLLNYYYLMQWDRGVDWRTGPSTTADTVEYRYSQTIATVEGAYQAQHSLLIDTIFPAVQKALLNLPEPIYSIIPRWMPSQYDSINNGHLFVGWANDYAYWDPMGGDECHPDIIHGHSFCDLQVQGTNRGRVHMDPNGPANNSDTHPPRMPCLLSADPAYFGTNLLHLYIGHWALNWFGDSCLSYENWPQSPIGLQVGPLLIFDTYHGSTIPYFDGLRAAWRDYGPNFGYMNSGVTPMLAHYHDIIAGEAETYKRNFWQFRNLGTRIFQYPNSMEFNWNPAAIKQDQKWCAAPQFYFGLTFDEFSRTHTNEDMYCIDLSGKNNGLRYANTVIRIPTSPDIRRAMGYTFDALRSRVSDYYDTIEPGTRDFMEGMILQHGLAEYNVVNEGNPSINVLSVDDLVQYIVDYYKSQSD